MGTTAIFCGICVQPFCGICAELSFQSRRVGIELMSPLRGFGFVCVFLFFYNRFIPSGFLASSCPQSLLILRSQLLHRLPFTSFLPASSYLSRSPLTVHRSPFTVHRSLFTVHCSPFQAIRGVPEMFVEVQYLVIFNLYAFVFQQLLHDARAAEMVFACEDTIPVNDSVCRD